MLIRLSQFSFTSLGSELNSLFAEIDARATSLMNQSRYNTPSGCNKER
jgi:hypothetical protein